MNSKFLDKVNNFVKYRLIELSGTILLIVGLFLFISIISYTPDDPNFIFPENTEIKNLLNFQGSYIADLFFQSIGLISYLIPLTFIFTEFTECYDCSDQIDPKLSIFGSTESF